MSHVRTVLLLLISAFLVAMLWGDRARAEGDDRASGRWTLQEWLAQKDRNRLMDVWLSMNSPSPFEIMAGGSYLSSKTARDPAGTEASFTSLSGELRAYMQFVGLTAEYGNHPQEGFNDLTGLLNIRLFGTSLQNSSLTLHFGQRARTLDDAGVKRIQRNLFSQATLQLYIAKYFGLDTFYRRYESAKNDTTGDMIAGHLAEAGLFIDFKAVRIFGAWTQDRQTNVAADGTEAAITREGIRTGLRFYY